jgi:hypothetical protein
VYQQQQQQQEQQEQQEEQDAENPFLDPPFSRIKMVLVIFHYQNNILFFLHLCYLVATSTGSNLHLFQRWREWERQ